MPLPQRQNNPLAPAAYNGLSSIGANYEDKHFSKSATFTIPASGTLSNQSIKLDRDADFFWETINVDAATPPFGLRFTDSTGYQLSDSFIGSFAFASSAGIGAPYVLLPSLYMPAGSAILVDLVDYSGADNTVTILIQGLKRFYDEGSR